MHIAILSFYSGMAERGVEVYAQEVTSRLKSHHRITLITAADLPFKPRPYLGSENFILRRLYLDPTSLRIKRLTSSVLDKLKDDPPDILYPLNNGWQSILSKLFCLKHKTKLVLGGHAGPGWDDRINLWLCPDLFIAFSSPQAQWASRVNRKVNLVTIPHGVDTHQFRPKADGPLAHKLKLNLQPPIFVTTSALSSPGRAGETAKNVDLTIKAVAQLTRGSLLLLGSGPDSDRIDHLASKLLGPQRYHRFSVSHNVIQQYYQAADVFTLASSSSEAFGLAYLEALACNLPVVTYDDPLRHEIVGPAGVFTKNLHPSPEYSQALTAAVTTPWGDKPRRQALKFSWDQLINEYETVFIKLLAA